MPRVILLDSVNLTQEHRFTCYTTHRSSSDCLRLVMSSRRHIIQQRRQPHCRPRAAASAALGRPSPRRPAAHGRVGLRRAHSCTWSKRSTFRQRRVRPLLRRSRHCTAATACSPPPPNDGRKYARAYYRIMWRA